MDSRLFALFNLACRVFLCGSNVKCSSIVILTYFTLEQGDSFTPFSFILLFGIGDPDFLKYISSVFVELRLILLASSQWVRHLRSLLIFLVLFGNDLFKMCIRFVSSAKCLVVEYLMHLCRSLMYIRKSRGPRTDPWGTPCLMTAWSESVPSSVTYCYLSVR